MRSTDPSHRNAPGREPEAERPGWPLERIDDEELAALCEVLGIEAAKKAGHGAKDAAKRREALAQGLADPSLVSRALRHLSPFELVLLEALVDLGGIVELETLWDEACRRANIERLFEVREIERAIALLGCQLSERTPYGTERDLAGLLEPCCGTLSRMLSGISLLPRPPSDAELPAEAHRAQRRLRDHLLVAGRCAQLRVKRTKSGAPSRTQRRKFDAEIPTDDAPLWDVLENAVELGLVMGSEQSECLVPNLGRLKEAAESGFADRDPTPTVRVAASWAATGPIPVEHLVRHHQLHVQRKGGTVRLDRFYDRPATGREIAKRIEATIGLWCGPMGNELVVARPCATPGQADGHVLPNYDIILGPQTPLLAAAVLGCAAELVRLDRLASLRLTPESVRSAIASGLEVSEILEALDCVGSREAPQTVRRSVEEWAASTRLARVVRDRVVVLPPEVASRLAQNTGSQGMFELLAPGVLRVDAALTEAKLAKTLEEAGLSVRATQPAQPGPRAGEAAAPSPQIPDVPESVDPDARARVHEALARHDFPPLPAASEPRSRASDAPARASGGKSGPAQGGRASVEELMRGLEKHAPTAALQRELLEVVALLERWHRKLRPKARAKIYLPDLLQPDGLAGLLVLLAPNARAQILNRCTNPGQIERRATTAILEGQLSPLAAFALDDEDEGPPELDEFPVASTPRDIRQGLEEARANETPVWLLINRGGKKQVSQRLVVEAIEPRGRDLMVLASADDGGDDDGESARFAIPLTSVASVLAEGGPQEEMYGLPDDIFQLAERMAEAARRRRGR